jgi:hypothetical protein
MVTIDNDIKFKELQAKAPNAKLYVLLCDNHRCNNHFSKNTTIWNEDVTHPWLLNMSCTVCKSTWSTCFQCIKTKSKLVNTKQINVHRLSYHNVKKLSSKRPIETCVNILKKYKTTTDSEHVETTEKMVETEELLTDADQALISRFKQGLVAIEMVGYHVLKN